MASAPPTGPPFPSDLELTFVPADPPRESWFALWSPDDVHGRGEPGALFEAAQGGARRDELELVVPAGAGVERRMLGVGRVEMADAIESLLALPAASNVAPSTRVWAAVVRGAVGYLAEGRLLPWVSPDGWDAWRLDPLVGDELEHVDRLAAALPASAHCTPHDLADRIADPRFSVRACFDAVADRFVRTAAAPLVSGLDPFAAGPSTRVRHLRAWTESRAAPLCSSVELVLRLHPPADADPAGDDATGAELEAAEDLPWRVRFEVRSTRDPSLQLDATQVWARGAAAELLPERAEVELLIALRRAGELCVPLDRALDEAHPVALDLDDAEVDVVLEAADDLATAGIFVQWPTDLVSPRLERCIVVSAEAPDDRAITFADLTSLLEVDWEFLLDGLELSPGELAQLAAAKRSIVPLRGRWVRVTSADRARLEAPPPTLQGADVLAAALDGTIELDLLGERVEVRLDGAAAAFIETIGSPRPGEIELPPDFRATLRGYQAEGLAWLVGLDSMGLGGCLADDMGLGKTVQLLALHAVRGGPTLVVCPTTLLGNWEREAARFVPSARVIRYHGPKRRLPELAAGDLVVTTYGIARSDAEALGERDWAIVAADEAQQIKNPRSRAARAMRAIGGGTRIALTGTPVENRLRDLWAVMDWAVPGLLGTREQFQESYALPVERDGSTGAAQRLQKVVAPFLLRRRKTDPGIAPELPPKTERDLDVTLSTEQLTLYRATTEAVLEEIRAVDGISRRGLVLKLLTSLKQIVNHPAHFLGQEGPLVGRSGKMDAVDELVDQALESGEATLVFTQYVAMAELLQQHWATRGVRVGLLHGGLAPSARQRLVDSFQARQLDVLVLSLKAGGTGLNLTAATQVIHYDRWWNPAVEDQATDRAYRIGQTAPVTVHRCIAEGTVEDKVARLLENKRDLADRVIGGGEAWIGELTDTELTDLVVFSEPEADGEVR